MSLKKHFEGRLDRKNFIVGWIIFGILKFIAAVPTYAIFFIQHPLTKDPNFSEVEFKTQLAHAFSINTPEGILFTVLSLVVVIWSLTVYVRRFHDIGKSGKLALLVVLEFIVVRVIAHISLTNIEAGSATLNSTLALSSISNLFSLVVGIVILYLLLKKTDPAPNKYGEVPSSKIEVKNILLNK